MSGSSNNRQSRNYGELILKNNTPAPPRPDRGGGGAAPFTLVDADRAWLRSSPLLAEAVRNHPRIQGGLVSAGLASPELTPRRADVVDPHRLAWCPVYEYQTYPQILRVVHDRVVIELADYGPDAEIRYDVCISVLRWIERPALAAFASGVTADPSAGLFDAEGDVAALTDDDGGDTDNGDLADDGEDDGAGEVEANAPYAPPDADVELHLRANDFAWIARIAQAFGGLDPAYRP